MQRRTRYQGAIVRDDHILLIQHREHQSGRSYWLFPGGGIEPGESEEACVVREMKEETGLDVRVERLLVEHELPPTDIVRCFKTYLCAAPPGEPQPGYEPEPEVAAQYAITAVSWFDLRRPDSWGQAVRDDPWTYPQMLRVRAALGY